MLWRLEALQPIDEGRRHASNGTAGAALRRATPATPFHAGGAEGEPERVGYASPASHAIAPQ